jgi:hypothetical protein
MNRTHITTCYERKALLQPTLQQLATLDKIGARSIGLSITGILKAMSKKNAFLIARNGAVTFKGRKGRQS